MEHIIEASHQNVTRARNALILNLSESISRLNYIDGVHIDIFPDELQEIRFQIGKESPQLIANFDRTMLDDLKNFKLWRPHYNEIYMVMFYSKEWVVNPVKYEYGEEVEFFNGKVYQNGRQVFRKPLGQPGEDEEVAVRLPRIEIKLKSHGYPWSGDVDIRHKMKVPLSRFTRDELDCYIRKEMIRVIDDKYCYVFNVYTLRNGVAGMKYGYPTDWFLNGVAL